MLENKIEELAILMRIAEYDLCAADAAHDEAKNRCSDARRRLQEAVDAEVQRRRDAID